MYPTACIVLDFCGDHYSATGRHLDQHEHCATAKALLCVEHHALGHTGQASSPRLPLVPAWKGRKLTLNAKETPWVVTLSAMCYQELGPCKHVQTYTGLKKAQGCVAKFCLCSSE